MNKIPFLRKIIEHHRQKKLEAKRRALFHYGLFFANNNPHNLLKHK